MPTALWWRRSPCRIGAGRPRCPSPASLVLLLTGVLLTACRGSPSSIPAKPPSAIPPSVGTRQVTYEPFTAQGEIDPTLRVTETGTELASQPAWQATPHIAVSPNPQAASTTLVSLHRWLLAVRS